MKKPSALLAICLLVVAAAPLRADKVDLRAERLTEALDLLKPSERSVVDHAVDLIRKGMNTDALAALSTLTKDNPKNSSLRILTAYALLQLGNLVGAFDEAKKAEAAPNGNSYKCWFLGKLALLVGDREVCKREIAHAKKAGDMATDVDALEKELKSRN